MIQETSWVTNMIAGSISSTNRENVGAETEAH